MNGIDQLKDYPLVRCPQCGFAMLLVRSESASSGRKKVTYRCHHCDTETERLVASTARKSTINRPGSRNGRWKLERAWPPSIRAL